MALFQNYIDSLNMKAHALHYINDRMDHFFSYPRDFMKYLNWRNYINVVIIISFIRNKKNYFNTCSQILCTISMMFRMNFIHFIVVQFLSTIQESISIDIYKDLVLCLCTIVTNFQQITYNNKSLQLILHISYCIMYL